ncbi:ribokinase [Mycobacterium sp. M1]|uniref:Ribokinase n=2 Tax=Mycolicibacter acidiphilus TaxID=2835306 RepID=A0ABS5RGT2_9MYCO|nr:PfkB family carbohydrate kinase [Mycolicibacter acidiphilus]MBS9533384.1 ribokinase [Mycolicibacter acidiphilus]
MTTRICVLGSVNSDTVLTVGTLPKPGETVPATAVLHTAGGKGANQAVAAARAGGRVRFIGAVGDDDAGVALRGHLAANDVDTADVATVPGPSGSAVITVDAAGENTIVVAAGANAALAPGPELLRTALADADVLLLQLEIPLPAAIAGARAARAAGVIVMLNASPAGVAVAELAALVDVVVLNKGEAAHWAWPVAHRVITLGARGARYLGGGREFTVPAVTVTPVDTSGAGDVFAGVLAACWPDGPEAAMRRACAAGALATLTPGAGDCAPSAAQIDAALSP